MWNDPLLDLACLPWQRQAQLQRRWCELWPPPGPEGAGQVLGSWWSGLREVLALPFDMARHQHAAGVRCGVWPRSLLASQRFEQQLTLMEALSLGPLARRL